MNTGTLRRWLVGLALIGATVAAPALASSPVLTDDGSGPHSISLRGSGFTPSNRVYIVVADTIFAPSVDGDFETTPETCYRIGVLLNCSGGGDISASLYDFSDCIVGWRTAWAWDYGSQMWVGPLQLGCG